jgi:hypothetical protein
MKMEFAHKPLEKWNEKNISDSYLRLALSFSYVNNLRKIAGYIS